MKHLILLAALVLSSSIVSAQLSAPPTVSIPPQLIDNLKSAPTEAELAAQNIVDMVNGEIRRRVMVHRTSWESIWRNRRPGCTPAAVLAALGTKAVSVFQFASENLDHIDRCAKLVGKTRADFISDEDCVPPLAYTAHEDGTVTLN